MSHFYSSVIPDYVDGRLESNAEKIYSSDDFAQLCGYVVVQQKQTLARTKTWRWQMMSADKSTQIMSNNNDNNHIPWPRAWTK